MESVAVAAGVDCVCVGVGVGAGCACAGAGAAAADVALGSVESPCAVRLALARFGIFLVDVAPTSLIGAAPVLRA